MRRRWLAVHEELGTRLVCVEVRKQAMLTGKNLRVDEGVIRADVVKYDTRLAVCLVG